MRNWDSQQIREEDIDIGNSYIMTDYDAKKLQRQPPQSFTCESMKGPSFEHLRDIIILPFTVTVVTPYLIFDPKQNLLATTFTIKLIGLIILLSAGTILFFVFLFSIHRKKVRLPVEAYSKVNNYRP